MRKFVSILFALVLMVSFSLVTAVPAAAADPVTLTVAPFTLDPDGDGDATWSDVKPHTGTDSVLLSAGTGGEANMGRVRVEVSAIPMADFTGATFWVWEPAGAEHGGSEPNTDQIYPYGDPYINILIDMDGDGVFDEKMEGIGSITVGSPTSPDTHPTPSLETWVQMEEGYGFYDINDGMGSGIGQGPGGTGHPWDFGDLAEWKAWFAANQPDWTVVGVEITFGYWGPVVTKDVYVDDITINGTLYALEAPDFTSIQDAINAAGEGDTITVAAGTYRESLVVATENITLEGAQAGVDPTVAGAREDETAESIIDGGGNLGPGVEITADDVTFQGFTVRNFTCTTSSGMGAIWVKGGGVVIDSNLIYNILPQGDPISEPAGMGIAVWTESGAHTDIDITNNVIHDVGSIGIRVRDNYDPTGLTGPDNILLEGNEVYNCGNSNILIAGFVEGVAILDNEIYDSSLPNQYGIRVCIGAEDITIDEGNYIHDNLRNIVLAGTDNVTITDNTIEDIAAGSINIYITNNYNLDNGQPWLIGPLTVDTLSTNIEISSNNVTDAGHGVKIQNFGAATPGQMAATTTINFNNISGHTEYGVENTIATDVDANNNYWGNASGPELDPPVAGYESYGDKVSTTNVNYEPWLLAVEEGVPPTTFDKTLALKDKWTLVSTNKLVANGTTWVGTDELAEGITVSGVKYALDPVSGSLAFGDADATDLEPVDALYVKTKNGGGVGINYSTGAPGVSSKDLEQGWNLVSSATTDPLILASAILSPLSVVQIGDEIGRGMATFASQGGYNQYTESKFIATGIGTNWTGILNFALNPFDGYWVYMNAAKNFGVIPD